MTRFYITTPTRRRNPAEHFTVDEVTSQGDFIAHTDFLTPDKPTARALLAQLIIAHAIAGNTSIELTHRPPGARKS